MPSRHWLLPGRKRHDLVSDARAKSPSDTSIQETMLSMTIGMRLCFLAVSLGVFTTLPAGEPTSRRYALILTDPPVSGRFPSSQAARSHEAEAYRRKLEREQAKLRTQLEKMRIPVTGATQMVSNAIFVQAPPGARTGVAQAARREECSPRASSGIGDASFVLPDAHLLRSVPGHHLICDAHGYGRVALPTAS